MAGNNWRHILDRRIIVSAGGTSLCNRNAGRNALNKDSIITGTYPLALPPSPPQIGVWAVLHEIRSEYAQLAVLFLSFLVVQEDGQ
jgi:hypothetical protein